MPSAHDWLINRVLSHIVNDMETFLGLDSVMKILSPQSNWYISHGTEIRWNETLKCSWQPYNCQER